MAMIGDPLKRHHVVPLTEPIPDTWEPLPSTPSPSPSEPSKTPELEPAK